MISHIDGVNRLIYLDASTVNADIHPLDIYREVRSLRKTNEELRKYNMFMKSAGYDPKGAGKFTERYFTLIEGTRIVPYDISHVLTITGTLLTDDGQEGVYCFNRVPLTAGVYVDIQYVPPQVEVVVIQGGSGLDDEQSTMLKEIHSGTKQMIHIDADNVVSGDGSSSNPFNRVSLAIAYGEVRGIRALHVHSNITLDSNINGYEVYGLAQPTLDLNGYDVTATDFYNVQISGISTGLANYRQCNILHGTQGINGVYHECAISGDIFLQDGAFVIFSSCFSGIASNLQASVNLGGYANTQLAFRSWAGGVAIKGMEDGCSVTVGITNGGVLFDSSCHGGSCHISGTGNYQNNGTVTIIEKAFISKDDVKLTQEEHDQLMNASSLSDVIAASQY